MNIVPPSSPKINTPSWEWDERRFEVENLVKDGGSFIVGAGNAIAELFTDKILAKPEGNSPKTVIGGETELKFNQSAKQEETLQEKRKVDYQKKVSQEQAEVKSKQSQKKAREHLIENVNKTIGGITNLSYEGIVDENGNLRLDIQAYYEKANSQLNEQEIKTKRQSQIAQVTGQKAGGIMGENELLKGGENFGHFTKAPG